MTPQLPIIGKDGNANFQSLEKRDAAARKVYGIAELTRLIKATLENEIGAVWIEGEISNFTRASSGHLYFTLKDADAQIRGAMFRGSAMSLRFQPRDGLKVRVNGEITVYEKRGEYQIIVRKMEEAGKGDLQEQFEKLKAKLQAEGLFDPARKKKLPLLPQRIGVVTSPTGAAIRDMLNILSRRFPNLRITLLPVRVQGAGAAEEIAAAINLFNELKNVDVMIVGRGGGSLEDLWSFNEEVVARAIARSKIPTISAVGHEIDFTISDFVADLRAPTPSAAAELVVQPKSVWVDTLRGHARHLTAALENKLLAMKNRYTRVSRSYVFREPQNIAKIHRQRLDAHREKLATLLRGAYQQKQQRLDEIGMRIGHRMEIRTQALRQQLQRLESQLRALGPMAVLERGYSITQTADGGVVRDPKQVKPGETLDTRVAKGKIESVISKLKPDT